MNNKQLVDELQGLLAKFGKKTIQSEKKTWYRDKYGESQCPWWSVTQRGQMLYLKGHYIACTELKAFGYDTWIHERGDGIARFDLSVNINGSSLVAHLDHHTLVDDDYRNEDTFEEGRDEWDKVTLFVADLLPKVQNFVDKHKVVNT